MKFIKKNILSILLFIIGISIGAIIMTFFFPEEIAKLNNGEEVIVTINNDKAITANEYYNDLKDFITIDVLLQKIDTIILDDKYPTTDQMIKESKYEANDTINIYKSYYKYTEKEFLLNNGFNTIDEYYNYMLLEHKRILYEKDYLKTIIKQSDINYYYNKKYHPNMDIKYITGSEEILTKILKELDNKKTYDEIIKKYKKDINYYNYNDIPFDNNIIEKDIYNEALELKDNTHTDLVSINDTYYIIFRNNTKEKEKVNKLKNRIINILVEEKIENDQENSYYFEALINLRKENKVEFKDTLLNKKYKEYLKAK